MLDTDTDWTAAVEKLAKRNGIQVLTSEPCLEALLLRVLGKTPGQAKDLKRQFAPYVQNDGTRREDYVGCFGLQVLQATRQNEQTIDELLKLLGL